MDKTDKELKALLNNQDNKLKAYQAGLERDFPKPYELACYVRDLEQYCAVKLGTKTRQETRVAASRANRKKLGRKTDSVKISEKKFGEMYQLYKKYLAEGEKKERARERAKFKGYDQYSYYKKKYDK